MPRRATLPLLLLCYLLSSGCQAAKQLSSEAIYRGGGVIWGMSLLSPNRLLFTERQGKVKLLTLDDRQSEAIVSDINGAPSVWAQGQGGLMDVAVAPDYKKGDWIYFTYSKPVDDSAATTLARSRLEGDTLIDWQDLLVTRSTTKTARHFGSRIAFDGRGHLFFGVGDRGHRPNGQDLSTHAGSILRLNLDGSVPRDNPFVDQPSALPEIWSYGHRNPQGLCFDQHRQILWQGEHGPRGGDEINRILPGLNYGWAEVSHGKEYTSMAAVGEAKERDDVEPSKYVYIPSIAPGSLLCYSGDRFPQLKNSLLQGSLKLTHLNQLKIGQGATITAEQRHLQDLNLRLRSLAQSPAGDIYIGTDNGLILKLISIASN